MRWFACILIGITAWSCGTGVPRRSPAAGGSGGSAAPRAGTEPDATRVSRIEPAANGPSERECEELFAHALTIGIAGHPAKPAPSEPDQQAIRAELRGQVLADCRDGTRETHRCGLAAKTLDELAACHSTRSSSTSNSSVAPGGIKPPAPRSP